jgi:hypothetical protein
MQNISLIFNKGSYKVKILQFHKIIIYLGNKYRTVIFDFESKFHLVLKHDLHIKCYCF